MKKIVIICSFMCIFLFGCTNVLTDTDDYPNIETTSDSNVSKVNVTVTPSNEAHFVVPIVINHDTVMNIVNGSIGFNLNSISGNNLENFEISLEINNYIYEYVSDCDVPLKLEFKVEASQSWNIGKIASISKFELQIDSTIFEIDVDVTIESEFNHALVSDLNISNSTFEYYSTLKEKNLTTKIGFNVSNLSSDLSFFDSYIYISNVYSENDYLKLSNIIFSSYEESKTITVGEDNVLGFNVIALGTILLTFDVESNLSDDSIGFISDNIIIEYKLPGSEISKTFIFCNVELFDISVLS